METLKNIVYAGVGLASTTSDKVKETINDLVEKGKISDTEGKKIIDDIFKTTESTIEEFETKVKSMTDKINATFDFKGKKEDKVVVSLEKKIAELERELAEAKKATQAKAAPKRAAAKKTSPAKKTTTRKTAAKKTTAKKMTTKASNTKTK
ncbi:phasin family protein [Parvicella tangerina]|uniref:Polyhydroxyalkanoate synthesis regulator phasin n=1 Tax=Parvicella tangerina TaxID=2829795 RepID=A0A916N9P9_9FLAO|nr:hypothetical protein [Parvicella tangerina]CAG5077638.1 hypothetical protein CRYO30217_00446 [Parvicella tangerina]